MKKDEYYIMTKVYTYKNLEVGQIYKSYRQLCNALGASIEAGNAKLSQFREWDCHFSYHKDGNKFIIDEIYTEVKEKLDLRKEGRNRFDTPLRLTNPKLAQQWDVEKNGELSDEITRTSTDEYYWNCDGCNKNIISSPLKRLTRKKGVCDEAIKCPYCSLSKGAKMVYNILELNNVNFRQELTFDDLYGTGQSKRRLRFDFAVMDEDMNLISLIEYDGGYHDIHEDTKIHDQMKNEYCASKNIPLLRIHHSEIKRLDDKLYTFLGLISPNESKLLQLLINENLNTEKQIEQLKRKLEQNNKKIKEITSK